MEPPAITPPRYAWVEVPANFFSSSILLRANNTRATPREVALVDELLRDAYFDRTICMVCT